MSPASRAYYLPISLTHSLRCGLEECRQLRWLDSCFHPNRALVILSCQRAIDLADDGLRWAGAFLVRTNL